MKAIQWGKLEPGRLFKFAPWYKGWVTKINGTTGVQDEREYRAYPAMIVYVAV